MTGFGRGVLSTDEFDITVDASSVNKRSLEVSSGLPREWQRLEARVGEFTKGYFSRGRVQISCSVRIKGDFAGTDFESLKSAFFALKKSAELLGVEFKPDLNTIIALDKNAGASCAGVEDIDALWEKAKPAFAAAFDSLSEMREREGAVLKKDLKHRISLLSKAVEKLKKRSVGRPQAYKATLLERLSQLGPEINFDDERVIKEICIFADKCDVSEEITRIKSHLAQFLSSLEESAPVGRKLDFICQELGREINTASNKAADYEFSRIAIDFKNELERIREQVQNIE